ncbi:hypothetical protein PS1_039311 [Malus domestica]
MNLANLSGITKPPERLNQTGKESKFRNRQTKFKNFDINGDCIFEVPVLHVVLNQLAGRRHFEQRTLPRKPTSQNQFPRWGFQELDSGAEIMKL